MSTNIRSQLNLLYQNAPIVLTVLTLAPEKELHFQTNISEKTVQKPFSCQGKSADKLNLYRDAKVLIIDHDEMSENLINSSTQSRQMQRQSHE